MRSQTIPGFFLATGFSGHGFGIGPGAGRLMADLVAGDPPVVDPTPFRFSRFTEEPARPRKWRALPSPSVRRSMAARQRALFAVLCFVWGTTWLAMKVGIAVVPPGVFAGTRWTVAGLMLLLWRWARGQRLQIPDAADRSADRGRRPDGVASTR